MPSEFRKHRYSRYFMAPVWIALALCATVLAFLFGEYLVTKKWSTQEVQTLNMSALNRAAEGVMNDRIEFKVYRDLLRDTLAHADAHEAAFRSINDVLKYGGAFAEDLKAELEGMAPQVYITTTTNKAGLDAADALVEDFQGLGMKVVSRDSRDPSGITASKVTCNSADICKNATMLVSILRDKGYTIGEPTNNNVSQVGGDPRDAASLYEAKTIRVVLVDPKQSQLAALPSPGGKKPHTTSNQQHQAVGKGVKTARR